MYNYVVVSIMDYLTIIKYATLAFPLIAFLFTIPFILVEYHKYGSVSLFKSVIIYIFIYYLICAYFLVILPLPKISEVAKMTGPTMQLKPFDFVVDFLNKSSFRLTNIHTYLKVLRESYFYVPVFNIFLTVPFGMFLRYMFKCNIWKTIILTFLLSLFFELTQLSGLYFIYPRAYRLFDVDDLILNTLGGMLGYIIVKPILRLIPTIDEVNKEAREKGKVISGFRRSVAFLLDLFIVLVIVLFFNIFVNSEIYWSLIIAFWYYFIIPLILNTSTIGERFLNIQVLDYDNCCNYLRLILRKVLFILFYLLIPLFILIIMFYWHDGSVREFYGLLILGLVFFLDMISCFKYLFTNKDMLYEKLSKTKLVSTIK